MTAPTIVEGRLLVTRRDGWWVVDDLATRETLSGGFARKGEALAEARRLLGRLR